jgi:hypothetical protein
MTESDHEAFVSEMVVILHLLKRKSPRCIIEQSIPAGEISASLLCKYCGFAIQLHEKDNGIPEAKTKNHYFIILENIAQARLIALKS